MKILDRYIITEMIGPLFAGAATFTLLFMSADHLFRVARLVVEGKQFNQAVEYLLTSIPSIMVLTFPMAVLLACLLSFGRLSSDSEIVAMRAGGVSFYRIAFPGVLLTLLVSLCSFVLNETIVPDSAFHAHNLLIRQLQDEPAVRENITLRDAKGKSERRVFARRYNMKENVMYDVTIIYYQNDLRAQEVYSKRVSWENNKWVMHGVHTLDFDAKGSVSLESRSEFAILPLSETPDMIAQRERMPEEMTRAALWAKITEMRSIQSRLHSSSADINRYLVMYHQKVALPFTCFVFGLLGIPLGVRPHRTSPSVGLGISLIFILAYYVIMSLCSAFGEKDLMPPQMAAWLPNALFGGVGLHLIMRAGRL